MKDGRSQVLTNQMRRHVQIGSGPNRDLPEARLVEAYCAWRLGERDRLATAAAEVEKRARVEPQYTGLLYFVIGLRESLRYDAAAGTAGTIALPGAAAEPVVKPQPAPPAPPRP